MPARGTPAIAGHMVQQRIQQRAAPVAAARMHHQTRRLVDDQQRFVLEHDVQRNVFRLLGQFADTVRARSGPAVLAAHNLCLGSVSSAPSTATRPSRTQACRRLRECCGNSSASTWSRRHPAQRSGTQDSIGRSSAIIGAVFHRIVHDAKFSRISPVFRLSGAALLIATLLAGCGLLPGRQGRNRRLVGQQALRRGQGRASRRHLGQGHQVLREARGALSLWPLCPAGPARTRLRLLEGQRSRLGASPPATASSSCTRTIRTSTTPTT